MASQQLDQRSDRSEASSQRGGQFELDQLQELHESKQALIIKVQGLKKELQDWRARMDGQVRAYKSELVGLQQSLQDDVSGLRSDLQALKQRIRTQLGTGDELLGAMAHKGDPPTRQLAAAAAPVAAAEQQQQQQTGDGGAIPPQ